MFLIIIINGLLGPKERSGMGGKETGVMTHGTTTKINRRGGDLFCKFVFAYIVFHQCCFEAKCDFRKPHT